MTDMKPEAVARKLGSVKHEHDAYNMAETQRMFTSVDECPIACQVVSNSVNNGKPDWYESSAIGKYQVSCRGS